MLCVEVTASSICDVLILACIRFATLLINPQCLSFDIISVCMTWTNPCCPFGNLWDFNTSPSDFSNGQNWVFPMTLQMWLIFCHRRAVLLSSTYQHGLFLTFPGCFLAWLTDMPSWVLCTVSLCLCSNSGCPRTSAHSTWSDAIWAFIAVAGHTVFLQLVFFRYFPFYISKMLVSPRGFPIPVE